MKYTFICERHTLLKLSEKNQQILCFYAYVYSHPLCSSSLSVTLMQHYDPRSMAVNEFIWLSGYRSAVRKPKERTHSRNLEQKQG